MAVDDKKKKKSLKVKARRYAKNLFRSANILWRELAVPPADKKTENEYYNDESVDNSIPALVLVNGIVMTVKDAAKTGKKGKPLSNVANLTYEQMKEVKDIFVDNLSIPNAIPTVKKLGKEVKWRVKTGNLLSNSNTRETAEINREQNQMNEFITRIEELEKLEKQYNDFNYDSFGEGGLMSIKNILEMNKIKLQQKTFAESLNLLSNMSKANEEVKKLADFILAKTAYCESLEKSPVNDLIVQNAHKEMLSKFRRLSKAFAENEVVDNTYADTLGSMAVVIIANKANYEMKAPNESNIDELLAEIKREEDEINEISANVGEVIADEVDEITESVEVEGDDLIFDPIIDENYVDPDNLVAAGELRKYAKRAFKEDITGIGALVSAVMMVPALITNVTIDAKNKRFVAKYGSSATISQPLLASNALSKETVKQLSKAMEIKTGLQLKAILESTVAAMDGGSVNKRLRQANVLSKSKIDVKDAKLFAANPLSYDQILGVFSEGKIVTDFLGYFNTDYLYVIPSAISHFKRNMGDLNLAFCKESITPSGEGIDIEEKRSALPTYLNVNIKYDAPKSIVSFDRATNNMETIIGVEVNPKVVSSSELVKIIKENSFEKVKTTKEEKTFAKRFTSILKFWKAKKNTPQAKVLESSSMSSVINKISNIKTPLFHVMIEHSDYVELKKQGIDLMNKSTYAQLMTELPIISITIVVEDTRQVYMSEGTTMIWTKKSMDDYINSIGVLEKELRATAQFRHNL